MRAYGNYREKSAVKSFLRTTIITGLIILYFLFPRPVQSDGVMGINDQTISVETSNPFGLN